MRRGYCSTMKRIAVNDPSEATAPDRTRSSHRRSVVALGSAAVLVSGAGAAVVGTAGVAGADDLTVSTCADSGAGSLRDAIATAVASSGADTITITATCTASGPVAVGSPLDVSAGGPLAIVGPGADDFVLDGGGSVRILNVDDIGAFSISGVTIRNGQGALHQSGGAGLSTTGAVSISGVVFTDNVSDASGGGALNVAYASSVSITDSTFAGNDAGIGAGGALYLHYVTGPVTISNSTFADNVGGNGGAIRIYSSAGDLEIYNSTFSGNTTLGGGAISTQFYGNLYLVFSTVADNTSTADDVGGLYVDHNAAGVAIAGSIFAGNSGAAPGAYEVDVHVPTGEHHNLFEGPVSGFTPSVSDVLGLDPLLGPLADNGGPTRTRALGAGSPAIDAGPTAADLAPAVFPFPGDTADQRGAPYVRISGGTSDIGAFEVQPEPTPAPGPEPAPAPEPTFTG